MFIIYYIIIVFDFTCLCPELVLYEVVNNHKLHESLDILGIPILQGQWWKRD